MAGEYRKFKDILNEQIENIEVAGYQYGRYQNAQNLQGLGDRFATWIACTTLSQSEKYKTQEGIDADELQQKLDSAKKMIKNSSAFKDLFTPANADETMKLIFGDTSKNVVKEMRKPNDVFIDFSKHLEKFIEVDREREEREKLTRSYQKDILRDLQATKSSSFSAKLKSFFVGNSREYKQAMEALEGASKGTVSKEEAAEAIKHYLDIRKDKVRNHQYGRDRFDGMMKGLRTLMEPKEFEAYCKGVDEARRQRDPKYNGKTDPDKYKTEQEKARDREAREAEKTRKEAELNRERLAKDLADPGRAKRNEQFLDWLGGKSVSITRVEQLKAERYLTDHPSVREAARKLCDEKKIDVEVPEPVQPEKRVEAPSAQSGGGAPSAQ